MHCTSIRGAHAVDARGIYRLGSAVFGRPWNDQFPDGASHLDALIGSEGWTFVVAESDGGRPIGVAVVQPANDDQRRPQPAGIWGELLFLAVAEDQRGTGLGGGLLRVAEARACDGGYLGLMATSRPDRVEWFTTRGWTAVPADRVLGFADLRRGAAAAAAGRPVEYYWTTPVVPEFPRWVWRALDPQRPVTAWAVHPEHRRPGPGDVGRIAAELERQESFGLGRLPENLRAFLDRLRGRPPEPGALGEADGPV